MKTKFIILVFLVAVSIKSNGQDKLDSNEHQHEHLHVHEVGISFAPAYFFNEEEFSLATHLHYVYNFPHTKWGLGLGYERVFDEHKHNFVGLEVNYRPVHALTLNFSPGVTFEGEHKHERDFAVHFETVYEFEFGAFHLGPMLELAYHPEDYHISFGVHIGLGI